MSVVAVETPHGRANAHVRSAGRPQAALILGHGAGGGVASRDLAALLPAAWHPGVLAQLGGRSPIQ